MTSIDYSDAARKITVKKDRLGFNEATGQLTEITRFDQLGRVRLSQDAAGNYVQRRYYTPQDGSFSYELVSNPYVAVAGSDPPAPNNDDTVGWTVTTRDTVGRLVNVEHFGGAALPSPWGANTNSTGKVATVYNANCSTTTDEAGVSHTNCTDGLGRLISVAENGIGATTTYDYDALDDLTTVTQGSTTRSYDYSSLRRLRSATNPESGTITYLYDGNGNLHSRAVTGGATTTFGEYNGIDQVTGITYSDSTPSVAYNYTKGWLTQVSSSVSSYGFDYTNDELGRVTTGTQTTAAQAYAFTLHYYPFMGVKDITYPISKRTLNTAYDSGGRPSTLSGQIDTNPATNYVTSSSYAPQGAISSLAFGNSLTETRQYNWRLQLTQIQLGSLFTVTNRYDPAAGTDKDLDCSGAVLAKPIPGNNGNVLAQTLNGVVRNYSYDAVNRLCWATQGSTWTQGFTYDALGNRAVPVWTGQLPNQTVEAIGGLGAYGTDNRVIGWAYDAAGNITGIPAAAGSVVRAPCASTVKPGVAMMRTACYDAENRMTSETDANGNTTTYAYDGDGRRVSKTLNGVTTIFVYDPQGQLAQEYGGLTIPASEVGTRYVTTDHLGSTRLLTKSDPTVAQTYDYLPFGQEFFQSSDSNPVRFTGKERDAESGLDYFGARYMSSAQGRFTSPDPFTVTPGRIADPQQLNLYAYVRNNPLKHIDPTGMVIDDAACQEDKNCAKKWQQVQNIANQQDKNGNYLHPELHNVLSTLQSDSRTFVLENSKLSPGTAGLFTITNFTASGTDFTRATLQLDFKQIQGISNVTAADLVPGFNKYQGLLNAPIDRLAETFGHEGAHGLFSIENPAQAVGIQQILNDRDAAMRGVRYPYPTDIMQKIDAANKALIPTEKFAQQVEKIINGELQADRKKQ